MDLKGLLEFSWFMRVVLVLWLISAVFVLFLLGKIDYIIHHDLYGFGLQFSYVWASPYWAFLRLIYVCLAVPAVLSAVVFGFDLWRKFHGEKRVSGRVVKAAGVKAQPLKGNHMRISCASCKRTFSKPLTMLDFSSGKAKLVNICPFCNARLGDAGRNEGEKDVETRVLGPDEKVKMNKRRRR